jgi:hypothetical protein
MADAPASPATRSAPKPGDSEFAEAPPPHADRRLANVQALGQLANTFAMRATENDPRPLRPKSGKLGCRYCGSDDLAPSFSSCPLPFEDCLGEGSEFELPVPFVKLSHDTIMGILHGLFVDSMPIAGLGLLPAIEVAQSWCDK